MSSSVKPSSPGAPPSRPAVPASVVIAVLSAMAGAWIAAGSAGMLADCLRHALAWLALVVCGAAGWPPGRRDRKALLAILGAAVVSAAMVAADHPAINVAAMAVLLAALAWTREGLDRRVLTMAAAAVTTLAVYRLAVVSIPTVWVLTDRLGGMLGAAAGWVSGRPLRVGATFGGLDFLVLSGALFGMWLAATASPRWARAAYAGAAILLGHLAYLVLLSYAADMISALPDPPPPPDYHVYVPPPWSWSRAAAAMLPWNLPLAALLIHLATAAAMLRWGAWRTVGEPAAPSRGEHDAPTGDLLTRAAGPAILAAAIPLVAVLSPGLGDLADKRIVAYGQGRLDFDRPQHDRLRRADAGLYGMLPALIEGLGGRFEMSQDLSEDDLAGADALLLLHPARPWTEEQLARIDGFVRGGGALLVGAECRMQEDDLASTFNEPLRGTHMEVRFDTAIYERPRWQQSLEASAHPAVVGLGDRRNRYGIASGSSIEIAWPARPILTGTWGWSDPGSDAMLTGMSRYDAGERLGDLVLAAERRWGRGTIVVLGDVNTLANQTLPLSYPFAGRLLSYLATRPASPQDLWRQALGAICCGVLIAALARRPDPVVLAAAAVAMGFSLTLGTWVAAESSVVLPDAKALPVGTRLACLDGAHLGPYSDDAWKANGLGTFHTVLMQNGYLPLMLPELSARRMEGAELFVSIAPARPYSAAEIALLTDYVESGGALVAMAGAEDVDGLERLLARFGLRVPRSPVGPNEKRLEPEPVGESPGPDESPERYGRFPTNYLDAADYGVGDYRVSVWMHAAWPVECDASDPDVLVRGYGDVPLAIRRAVGSGNVVLVGDTCFAMNRNFGWTGGEPSEETTENAHFWRWLLTRVTPTAEWIPPNPAERRPAKEKPEETRPAETGDGAADGPPAPEAPDRFAPERPVAPGEEGQP